MDTIDTPSGSPPPVQRLALRRLARRVADGLSLITPRRKPSTVCSFDRIGIFAQWGIGDAVLSLPLIQGIKEAFPDAVIDLIGKPWLVDLFSGEPAIHGVKVLVPPWTKYARKYRVWESDWRRFARDLWAVRRVHYDILIAARFDVREVVQLRLLRTREVAAFGAVGGKHWVTWDLDLDLRSYNARHRAEVASYVLHAITGNHRSAVPHFTVDNVSKHRAMERLRAAGYANGPIVAVHGGAGHQVRHWGGQRFTEALAQGVSANAFIVIIADDAAPDGHGIRAPEAVPSMLWRSSLGELKGLLSVCDVLLCADSGVMHMAAACGCRVVALFGPQRAEWFGPVGDGHRVVKIDPMSCRPCFDACIYNRPLCMNQIDPAKVAALLRHLLADVGGKKLA